MKKMISLLVLVLIIGCAVSAFAGGGKDGKGDGDDICWNYVNPFGTDTVRAHIDNTGVTASWVINIGTSTPLLIPLTGSIQKDLDGHLRLNLHGNARDLSFNSPFIFDCWMDATLDPHTLNSVMIAPSGGNPSDLHSSVLAGCEDYFSPDDPFQSNDTLTKVSCRQFPNPSIGDYR